MSRCIYTLSRSLCRVYEDVWLGSPSNTQCFEKYSFMLRVVEDKDRDETQPLSATLLFECHIDILFFLWHYQASCEELQSSGCAACLSKTGHSIIANGERSLRYSSCMLVIDHLAQLHVNSRSSVSLLPRYCYRQHQRLAPA